MPRISFAEVEETPFGRLMGHNREVLRAWRDCERALYAAGHLSPELKEQVRRTLAYGNGCEYCQATGGRPADVHPDPKESLAVGFAELFVRDHLAIDDTTFDVLKGEFTDPEIAELVAFICFVSASQRFGAVMHLERELAPA